MGIGEVLHNRDGVALVLFSKHIGCMEFNEAKVLAILEALWIFVSASFQKQLMIESDYFNAIFWVSSFAKPPWRFHFHFYEFKHISLSLDAKFQHMGRLGNSSALLTPWLRKGWIDLRICWLFYCSSLGFLGIILLYQGPSLFCGMLVDVSCIFRNPLPF